MSQETPAQTESQPQEAESTPIWFGTNKMFASVHGNPVYSVAGATQGYLWGKVGVEFGKPSWAESDWFPGSVDLVLLRFANDEAAVTGISLGKRRYFGKNRRIFKGFQMGGSAGVYFLEDKEDDDSFAAWGMSVRAAYKFLIRGVFELEPLLELGYIRAGDLSVALVGEFGIHIGYRFKRGEDLTMR